MACPRNGTAALKGFFKAATAVRSTFLGQSKSDVMGLGWAFPTENGEKNPILLLLFPPPPDISVALGLIDGSSGFQAFMYNFD